MTLLEAKQALARMLDIDYTNISLNDVFSDTDLLEYINEGCKQAWSLARWSFTEASKTWTLVAQDVTDGYVNIPEDIMPSSIFSVWIDGEEVDRRDVISLRRYLQVNPTGTKLICAIYKMNLYFNSNTISTGIVVDAYGKKRFVPFTSSSATSDLLPFSVGADQFEDAGNNAIIRLAYAEALGSEKKKNYAQAKVEREKAFAILTPLAESTKDDRANEQMESKPMLDVPDFFGGENVSSNIGQA